jgi:hypothetical protein
MQVYHFDPIPCLFCAKASCVGKFSQVTRIGVSAHPMSSLRLVRSWPAGSNATYDKSCLNLTDEEVARRVKAGEKHVIRINVTSGILFLVPCLGLTRFIGQCCSGPNHPRRHRFWISQGCSRFVADRTSSVEVRYVPIIPPCFGGRRPRDGYHSRRSGGGELYVFVESTYPLI